MVIFLCLVFRLLRVHLPFLLIGPKSVDTGSTVVRSVDRTCLFFQVAQVDTEEAVAASVQIAVRKFEPGVAVRMAVEWEGSQRFEESAEQSRELRVARSAAVPMVPAARTVPG